MIPIPKVVADAGLWLNRRYYRQQLRRMYMDPAAQSPAWFDHRIDLHCLWPENLFWLERGVFPRKHITEGCTMLDLFCGDGYFSRYFYASAAGAVDAVDKDPSAIAHARRLHSHPRVTYHVLDAVREPFPRDQYDVIAWYEGIEHLNESDYAAVASAIKRAIVGGGVLSGSTPLIEPARRGKNNWEHQNEFGDAVELQIFLERDFGDVHIEVTTYPQYGGGRRQTAHFTCRDPR